EELHRALVLLRRRERLERAEIAALARLRVLLARVQAVRARRELLDHRLAYDFNTYARQARSSSASSLPRAFFITAGCRSTMILSRSAPETCGSGSVISISSAFELTSLRPSNHMVRDHAVM